MEFREPLKHREFRESRNFRKSRESRKTRKFTTSTECEFRGAPDYR